MNAKKIISQYLDESILCLNNLKSQLGVIKRIVDILEKARKNEKNVFLCGNGGSGSTASHMLCDLNKTSSMPNKKRLKAISLVDNVPIISALANDLSYSEVFLEQLKNLIKPSDVLIILSGSGNSLNVIKAAKYAKKNRGIIIGLTGFKGGKLKSLCDECLIIPSNSMYRIEDMHLMINHILVSVFRGGKSYL